MFDVGFFELLVIGVVALLVVGPERLPGIARSAGKWMGRARRMVGNLKAEVDRELAAEELKKNLAKQAGIDSIHEIVEETKSVGEDIDRSINEAATAAESLDMTSTPSGDTPEASASADGGTDPKNG